MKYKPFEQGFFKYELGLKPLELSQWIEVDNDWLEQTQLKAKLLQDEREKVFQALPAADEASAELMQTLAQYLSQYFPGKFELKNEKFTLKQTGRNFYLNDLEDHALAVLSQWVQEDFCLMNTHKKEARLEAGCVCFPSRWKLIEKVGKNMAGIHMPVPEFNKNLEKPSTRFLLNTQTTKPMWRINWAIHASDELFAYGPASHSESVTEDNVLEKTYFRTERQTLRRLPQTGYVAFSIRTYLTRLSEIAANRKDAKALLETLRTVPEEVISYRGMQDLIEPLKAALERD